VLSGLTHAGVAMRQMVARARFRLAPPVASTHYPCAMLPRTLKSASLSESDSKALLRAAGMALPDEVLVAEKTALDAAIARVGFPLVIEDPIAGYSAQERGRRRARQYRDQGLKAFATYQALLDNARRHRPDADIQGILVGPMAKRGVEIIIGTLLTRPSVR